MRASPHRLRPDLAAVGLVAVAVSAPGLRNEIRGMDVAEGAGSEVARTQQEARERQRRRMARSDGVLELAEFVASINGYSKNSYKLTKEESIAMAAITEEFMKIRNMTKKT